MPQKIADFSLKIAQNFQYYANSSEIQRFWLFLKFEYTIFSYEIDRPESKGPISPNGYAPLLFTLFIDAPPYCSDLISYLEYNETKHLLLKTSVQ